MEDPEGPPASRTSRSQWTATCCSLKGLLSDTRVAELTRGTLTSAQLLELIALGCAIAALHIMGWLTLACFVVPSHFSLGPGQGVFGMGVGVTAYILGLRHAFDADHIAAIDNVTRKFLGEGRRPLSIGFWFSLGHSTVVFLVALFICAGFKLFADGVQDDNSNLHHITGIVGSLISGTFLIIIGLANLVALVQIIGVLRSMRRGELDEMELESQLGKTGCLSRTLLKATGFINQQWQMYPLGFLFGLGFDTATEVALLTLAAGAASGNLPWLAVLCLPTLFAAGMTLLDTIDGAFMNFAYGWALSSPVRKIYYNAVITGLSVGMAFIIGGLELLQVILLETSTTSWVDKIDLNIVGFIMIGLFVGTWAIAILVWHVGGLEKRWTLVEC